MGFDPGKDKELICVGEIMSDSMPIHVGVASYDKGEPKLAMTRSVTTTNKAGEEKTFSRTLGRMNEEEVVGFIRILGFTGPKADEKVRQLFRKAKLVVRKAKKQ